MASSQQLLLLGEGAGGAAPAPQYQISRSLRSNYVDTPYLNRTFPSAGNQRTWTFSAWFKRSDFNSAQLFTTPYGTGITTYGQGFLGFAGDQLVFANQGSYAAWYLLSSAKYRDPSAWYHVVAAVDTTQATEANRISLYVNGSKITDLASASYPAQNSLGSYNDGIAHFLGALYYNASSYIQPLDGYFTEIYFIDGQALTSSSFGETNANTGVWQPKAYTGTYGTNGFYVNFSDNSGTTSTTLGKDYSGNGNNWTPNNFSVTAGAGNDSLVDTPTSYGTDTGVGGEVRGNYCTLSPVELLNDATYGTSTYRATLSNGNLEASYPSNFAWAVGTMPIYSSGCKFYWEISTTITTSSNGWVGCSILGGATSSVNYTIGGEILLNGNLQYTVSTYTTGDVIGITIDTDANQVKFYKNNVLQGGAVDVSAYSNDPNTMFWPSVWVRNSGDSYICNFGQRAYTYTAPSGFKALCTQNLPTPTIGATSTTQAGDYFNTVLYTGNGGTLNVSGVGFQPDFVWSKSRSQAAGNHLLTDAVRGVTNSLTSNSTGAELTRGVSAFQSDGFQYIYPNEGGDGNFSAATYVAWNWKANGAGSTNNAGSIQSTVSANTTAGFSIVTYTGSSASTVGHGCLVNGAAATPSMIIAKQRNNVEHWVIYHVSTGKDAVLLFTTGAVISSSNYWGSGGVTSTVFGTGGPGAGNAVGNIVAYCFAPVAGYSAFGSYTGNGSSDGPFVYTGFKPAYVMIKYSSGTADWIVLDKSRPGYNVIGGNLYPNGNYAEDTQTKLDFTSNGFKIRADGTNANVNVSSGTYIYAAFAEFPFKYTLAR